MRVWPIAMVFVTVGAFPGAATGGLEKVISFTAKDAKIQDIIQAIAKLADVNVVIDPKISGRMPLSVKNVTAGDALHLVAGITGNKVAKIRGVVVVAPEETLKSMFGPGRTGLLHLRHAKSEEVSALLNKLFARDLSAHHYSPTNTVITAPK